MEASQVRVLDQGGLNLMAGAMLAGEKDFLDVDDQGYLAVPKGVIPTGIHLLFAAEAAMNGLLTQKCIVKTGGLYDGTNLARLAGFDGDFVATMTQPIEVRHEIRPDGSSAIWTNWHGSRADALTNRVDYFHIAKDGKFRLYQVGIITPDDGKTWRLHGEDRWRGELRMSSDGLVALPEHPKWGSFEGGSSKRTQIFNHPQFADLLKGIKLQAWDGLNREITPPFPQGRDVCYIQWYNTFASQKGGGIAVLNGESAWVHTDRTIGINPDADGIVRLWTGDIISFEKAVYDWGSKKGGPALLTGVRLESRDW